MTGREKLLGGAALALLLVSFGTYYLRPRVVTVHDVVTVRGETVTIYLDSTAKVKRAAALKCKSCTMYVDADGRMTVLGDVAVDLVEDSEVRTSSTTFKGSSSHTDDRGSSKAAAAPAWALGASGLYDFKAERLMYEGDLTGHLGGPMLGGIIVLGSRGALWPPIVGARLQLLFY